MPSLTRAIPEPVKHKFSDGTVLTFRRIGNDMWSAFCEHLINKRTDQIEKMKLNDQAKSQLIKELVGTSIDMDEMLSQASTIEGMSWLLYSCCKDDVTEAELMEAMPLGKVPELFKRIADLEAATPEEAESAGN